MKNNSLFAQSIQNANLMNFSSNEDVLDHAEQKMRETLQELSYNPKLHPAHTDRETGKWVEEYLGRERWTSGFFAGSMWYLYKLTGDPF
ncbi:MAG: hypothetical protein GVY20_00865, partial [Bacteroidetes bacterium]|nr:hypothetical protein [Bacteroidota bacterium]